ncbi:MAG: DUF255 domain-containing protein, partial [Salinisphaera sp.]|nr:DUF255 domain-containing protein [Salinisphaera sp.]
MPNRLANETSPYLLQHADNPVDWWPWCSQALASARAQDKPVLLSIGYSACHWCHVMAHESFEDEATAALMNARFINIKVDREERPDLDKIYQLAHQIMTQRPGGWPLTIALDPDTQAPFMAATYFPREAQMGMPAFVDVLRQVSDWFAANRHQLDGQKQRLGEVFARLEPNHGELPDTSALENAGRALAASFDSEYGGIEGAPKFPHPASLELAERLAAHGNQQAGAMLHTTLARMAGGGLFDHLGGGFFRYSVDERWEIPHFEKMLYDNGPLLALYARRAATDRQFVSIARATGDWMLREMRAPGGGFYSSLDADSGGDEGRFYVWRQEEIQACLGEQYSLFAAAYGLDNPPNFEDFWHLQRALASEALATRFELDEETAEQQLETARDSLAALRAQRVRPPPAATQLTPRHAHP